MITVSAREFRGNQASIFDKADSGEQIIIRRGKKQAYALVPVFDEDLEFSQDMQAKIDAAARQIIDLVNSEDEDPRQTHIDFDSAHDASFFEK